MSEFVQAWWHIITDPAHLAAEVTLMLVVDVLFLGMVWPLIMRAVARHDERVHGLKERSDRTP